jgi:hypothetical protein
MAFEDPDGRLYGWREFRQRSAAEYADSSAAVQFQLGADTAEYNGASNCFRPGQFESRYAQSPRK